MPKYISNCKGAPRPVGAYSPAVKTGQLLFCAGQIALDPETGELIEGSVSDQTRRVMENLAGVLEEGGSDWHHVVMTTIFLSDIVDAKEVNAVYGSYLSQDSLPARQTVAVKALPLGALVEISVVAETL